MKIEVLYIGRNPVSLEHFREILGGGTTFARDFSGALAMPSRYRENPVVAFYEKGEADTDLQAFRYLRAQYDSLYLVLVSETPLSKGERIFYLKAGVNHAIVSTAGREDIDSILGLVTNNPLLRQGGPQTPVRKSAYRTPFWKRLFDITVSLLGLLVLLPLLLLVALLIRLESRGPVIYTSKRVGSNYKVFDFLKFRSMYTDADLSLKKLGKLNQYAIEEEVPSAVRSPESFDPDALNETMLISDDSVITEAQHLAHTNLQNQQAFVKFANDPRITRMGRFIRKFSIDELPQLINILKGDMSVVGNRPLPLYEAERLTSDEYSERFMAPAGLTGLWQVEKRGSSGKLSADERKMLDIDYARKYSFWLDMKIILKTFVAFIQKENV